MAISLDCRDSCWCSGLKAMLRLQYLEVDTREPWLCEGTCPLCLDPKFAVLNLMPHTIASLVSTTFLAGRISGMLSVLWWSVANHRWNVTQILDNSTRMYRMQANRRERRNHFLCFILHHSLYFWIWQTFLSPHLQDTNARGLFQSQGTADLLLWRLFRCYSITSSEE